MLRKVLVCFAAVVLVGASLVPEDALAFRGGRGGGARASSFGGGTARSVGGRYGGGRYAIAGHGYGYRGGAYRAAAYRGAAYRGAAWRGAAYGTATAIGSAYAAYGYAAVPYEAYGYGSLNCAPWPRVGAYATAPWNNAPTCPPY